jgi:hypothetical protein
VQSDVPKTLTRLLDAAVEPARDSAWSLFVADYSRLLLYVSRRVTHDHDAAMDAYAFVLEKLRETTFGACAVMPPMAEGNSRHGSWSLAGSSASISSDSDGRAAHAEVS